MDPLLPNEYVNGFCAIDFQGLAEKGLHYVCVDLDNTLVPMKGMEPIPGAREKVAQAIARGFIKDICLVSNVVLPGRRIKRLRAMAEKLGIEKVYPCVLPHIKPMPRPFYQALKIMSATPAESVMIGDQIYSDIRGGNRVGLYTILVPPLAGGDHWTTDILGRRRREQALIRKHKLRPS